MKLQRKRLENCLKKLYCNYRKNKKREQLLPLFFMQRDGSSALGSAEGEALCPSESTFLCKAKYNVLYFTRGSCFADRPAEKYGRTVAIMGYAVVHMQKFKAGGVYGIQSHNNREHPPRTNPDIRPERTEQNYHVISCDNYTSRIKQLITEQATETKTVRKDAVVYCSFIITSDHETMAAMSEGEQRLFFNAAANWFAKRYGSENIVNATVHMDETTPHMHIGVVPVKDNRLSAKALFDKKELTAIQTEFARDVGSRFGLERGVEGSERTHLSEARFKLETVKNELEHAERQKEALQGEIEPLLSLKVEIDKAVKPGKSIIPGTTTMKTSDYKIQAEQAKAYVVNRDEIETLRERSEALDKLEKYLDSKSSFLGERENALAITEGELYEEKNRQAHLNELLDEANESLDRAEEERFSLGIENHNLKEENKTLKDSSAALKKDVAKLNQQVDELKRENHELADSNQTLSKNVSQAKADSQQILDRVNRVLRRISDASAEEFIQEYNWDLQKPKTRSYDIEL